MAEFEFDSEGMSIKGLDGQAVAGIRDLLHGGYAHFGLVNTGVVVDGGLLHDTKEEAEARRIALIKDATEAKFSSNAFDNLSEGSRLVAESRARYQMAASLEPLGVKEFKPREQYVLQGVIERVHGVDDGYHGSEKSEP